MEENKKKMPKDYYDLARFTIRKNKEKMSKSKSPTSIASEENRLLLWIQASILCKIAQAPPEKTYNLRMEFYAETIGNSVVLHCGKDLTFISRLPSSQFFKIMEDISIMYNGVQGYNSKFTKSTTKLDGDHIKAKMIVFMGAV